MNRLYACSGLLLLALSACNNEKIEQQTPESNYIEITKEQFLSEKMVIDTPQKIIIQEKVNFTGKIIPKIDGVYKLSAPVAGIVKEVKVYEGQNIKANTGLIKIGGNALIELQQEYAISAAKIKQLSANYERVTTLYNENIKTENEYLLAESDYKTELANHMAIKLKLQQIGLKLSNIENGNYSITYTIKSPIDGQLSNLEVLPGQFINSENEVAEIVNQEKVELLLSFFENDFSKIKQGQEVWYKSLNNTGEVKKAILSRVGIMLSSNSNTLECYASIENAHMNSYAINQMVNGEVIVAVDSVYAVPQHSVLSEGNSYYVMAVAKETENTYYLKKQKVKIGKSDKNNVELLDINKDELLIISEL